MINVEMSPSSSSALIWFSSWPFSAVVFSCFSLQRLKVIILKDYHLKSSSSLTVVRRLQRMKDSSRRPFWLCLSKSRKALPNQVKPVFYWALSARFCDLYKLPW